MDLRRFLCATIEGMTPPPVDSLVRELNRSTEASAEAAVALGCLGARAETAIPDLERAADGSRGRLREEALAALRAIEDDS